MFTTEIATLRGIIETLSSCPYRQDEHAHCTCGSGTHGISRGGYTLGTAQKELASLTTR